MKLVEMTPPKGSGSIRCRPDKVGEMKRKGWKEKARKTGKATVAPPDKPKTDEK
jgi:hypothetical protein